MNSIPVLYYADDASHDMDVFKHFWYENIHGWRDVEQLCLHCDLDKDRWAFVQNNFSLPRSVLRKKRDSLIWGMVVSEYAYFDDVIVRELKDYLDFGKVFALSEKVTEDCLREFIDRIGQKLLPTHRNWSDEFLNYFKDRFDWRGLTASKINRHLDDVFLERFKHLVDWRLVSEYNYDLSDDQLAKYKDYLDWRILSVYRKWSVKSMVRFYKWIDWKALDGVGNLNMRPSEIYRMKDEALKSVTGVLKCVDSK